MKNVAIIGAGVAGLSIGYLLSRNGMKVSVLEKESSIGGLARSFYYGDYVFDIGPHRFHTEEPSILAFIKEVLAENLVTILRSSGVWIFGKYHDWPLNRSTIVKLPLGIMFGVLRDLLVKKVWEGDSFEDYISNMYGKTLYEQFFKPYTEKFLHHPPNTIHSDWAKTGIDRSVIDNRAKANTLTEVIKRAILPEPINTQFLYPLHGGISAFSQKLAEGIEKHNGQILTNTYVDKIEQNGNCLTQIAFNGTKLPIDMVIWTAPLPILCSLINLPKPDLHYLSAICYNLEINGSPKRNYQWCYYGQKEVVFNRISTPKMFSENNAPKGKTGINAEVTCMEGDAIWQEPEKLIEPVKEDIVKVKFIEKYKDIESIHIERIPNVYPIYTMDYRAKLDAVMEQLKLYKNLILLGRTGTFWYNNMDHSVAAAMRCAENILNGKNIDLRFDWLKKTHESIKA